MWTTYKGINYVILHEFHILAAGIMGGSVCVCGGGGGGGGGDSSPSATVMELC